MKQGESRLCLAKVELARDDGSDRGEHAGNTL